MRRLFCKAAILASCNPHARHGVNTMHSFSSLTCFGSSQRSTQPKASMKHRAGSRRPRKATLSRKRAESRQHPGGPQLLGGKCGRRMITHCCFQPMQARRSILQQKQFAPLGRRAQSLVCPEPLAAGGERAGQVSTELQGSEGLRECSWQACSTWFTPASLLECSQEECLPRRSRSSTSAAAGGLSKLSSGE